MTAAEIRAIPLFAGVSDAGVERIAACAAEMDGETGQVLALQGDPGSGMFVILDGTSSARSPSLYRIRAGLREFAPRPRSIV